MTRQAIARRGIDDDRHVGIGRMRLERLHRADMNIGIRLCFQQRLQLGQQHFGREERRDVQAYDAAGVPSLQLFCHRFESREQCVHVLQITAAALGQREGVGTAIEQSHPKLLF